MDILEHNKYNLDFNMDYQRELQQIRTDLFYIAALYYRKPGRKKNYYSLSLKEIDPLIFTYPDYVERENIAVTLNPYPTKQNNDKTKFTNEKERIETKTYRILREIEKFLKKKNIHGIYCCVVKNDTETINNIKNSLKDLSQCTIRENYFIRNSKDYFELMRKYTALEMQYRKSIDEINKKAVMIMNNPDSKKAMTELINKIENSKIDYMGIRVKNPPSGIKNLLPGLVRFRIKHSESKSPINEIGKLHKREVKDGKNENDYQFCNKDTLIKFLNKWIHVWNILHPEDKIMGKVNLKNPETATALFNKLNSNNVNEFLNSIPQHIFYAKK